ncbi:limonene-1,2-epoxide hydrolase family protein [Parasphingorhabdus sp.]|uniref:limonene-1,2-epoxide hydrolase family protein n=1 Tax=Parasphingorhabdus sp. TaxID=2709688 RepID=UPI003A9011F8
MSKPIETATQFLEQLGKSKEAMHAAIRTYLTPDTVWENVGLAKTAGIEEALGLLAQFEQTMGVDRIRIDTLAIAASGDTVLTERIDYLVGADGTEHIALRVMGVLEIKNEKITAWRDYFDTAALSG